MIFLVLSGKMVLFCRKYDMSSLDGKLDLSQKIHGNMIFSVYMCKC